MPSILIDAVELVKLLQSPQIIIMDCRFDLANPSWGKQDYQTGHIPGAVYVHLNDDLSGPVTTSSGRHPLPDAELFTRKCSQWGIEPGKTVIVYDSSANSMAARLWWMLRAIGHQDIALLNGGYTKWLADAHPVETGDNKPRPTDFLYPPSFNPIFLVDSQMVLNVYDQPEWKLVDVRAPERFLGKVEPIDSIPGHIPGAINRFHSLSLMPDGTLRKPEAVKQDFEEMLAGIDPSHTIVYCGSGVTSCHTLFTMEYAGIKGARLYAGSWSEWIKDPNRPRIP